MADNNRQWRKLYDMSEWEWWGYSKMVKMFCYLITNVTYRRERLPSGNIISRGEMETTIPKLMKILDMTYKEVRIAIDRMKRTENIHTRIAHNHIIITLHNFDKYQGKTTKTQYNTAISCNNENVSDCHHQNNNNNERAGLGHGFSSKKGRVYSNKGQGVNTTENSVNKGVSEDTEHSDATLSGQGSNNINGAGLLNNINNRGRVSAKMGQGLEANSQSPQNTDKQTVSGCFINDKNSPKNDNKGRVSAKMGQGRGRVDTTHLNGTNTDKQDVSEVCNDRDKYELGQGFEQKMGKKYPYIEYNRIIEGINKYINTSPIFSKSVDSTEKAQIVSSILKSMGIEEIPESENDNQSPTELIEEKTDQPKENEEMKQKAKKPTKKRPPKENVTLTSICRRIFEPYYKIKVGEEYYWEAKDGGGMKYLIQKIRKARGDRGQPTDDESIVAAWSALLESISDQWMLEHLSIVNINSKYNEIVASAKRDRTNGTGGKQKSDKTREDKYERKQRILDERQRELMASTDAEDKMFAIYMSKIHAGQISDSISFDEWIRGYMEEEPVS